MIDKYFRLCEECFLEVDEDGSGCIYNVLSQEVIQIKKEYTSYLAMLENNISINELCESKKIKQEDVIPFLSKLVERKLGFYAKTPIYVDKLIVDHKWRDYEGSRYKQELIRTYIILESTCDNTCLSCNTHYYRGYACQGCFTSEKKEPISVEKIKELLDNLKKAGNRQIYFTGGDVFNNFTRNYDIIKYASELEFEQVVVILGGKYIQRKQELHKLATLNIEFLLNIEIIKPDYLFGNILENLSNNDIIENYSLCLAFSDNMLEKQDAIVKDISQRFIPKGILLDFLIPKNALKQDLHKKFHSMRKTELLDFSIKKTRNSCLASTISVYPDGKITVCPLMKNKSIGHIDHLSLALERKNVQEYWELTKDKIDPCKKCAKRYICEDCRFVELELSGNMHLTNTCMYKSPSNLEKTKV